MLTIKIILNVLLKTANRHFVLYKILALPTRIFNDTFVQYLPEFLFFGIDTVQHNYILYTEAELSHCTQSSITVCLANAATYSPQMKTCELSLYLHTTDNQNWCQRRLLLHHKTPILQRYASTWIYHLPERQHVVLRCWKDKAWTSSTHTLYGNGVIYSTSQCLLTTDKFQTLPDIIGNTQATVDPTKPRDASTRGSDNFRDCTAGRRQIPSRDTSPNHGFTSQHEQDYNPT